MENLDEYEFNYELITNNINSIGGIIKDTVVTTGRENYGNFRQYKIVT